MTKSSDQPTADEVVRLLKRNGVMESDSSSLLRALYSTDASLYRVVPLVVARPRDVSEVLGAVAACSELGVPLTARGAGTSIAGNAIGPGVVLDFRRHLNAVGSIDVEERTATVMPGAVHATLQKKAMREGLRFGPDPSTHSRCTVGGMIGNNACGSRALAYGRTSDNVVGLEVVTMEGEHLDLRVGDTPGSSPVLNRLRGVVAEGLGTIRTEFGQFTRQVSGYSLEHLLPERGFDVTRFMAGTEGTLGVTVGATVRLVRDAPHRVLLVLGYPSMADAADDVPAVLRFMPVACEGLDRRIVDVVGASSGQAALPELPGGRGWLFVELAGDEQKEVESRAARLARESASLASRLVTNQLEQAALWRIREEGAGLAARTLGRPALSGWEDAAVPPERLGAYLRDFETLLKDCQLDGVPYGHFGDGCIHVRIDFPLDEPDGRTVFRHFLNDAARLVASYGGSLSGEHGDGRARSELLPIMYSAEAIDLFRRVKHAFDPSNVLNPGVLVEPRAIDDDLRGSGRHAVKAPLGLGLHKDGGDFGAAVHRCTGVGKCVANTTTAASVMCPSYQASGEEKDSTRGRARVLQEMVDGRLVKDGWAAPEVEAALDLCLACKGCLSECPTGVDMASYKSEVLHQRYRGRLRPRSHYSLGWLPRVARATSPFSRAVNALLAIRAVGHLAKWGAGLDSRRGIPTFAERRFRAWTSRHKGGGESRPRVLLWSDTFTEFFTTEQGKAAVGVLESAGYHVDFLDEPACCGLTWISTGQLDAARRKLTKLVDEFYPVVLQGVPIVGLEPSCLGVLRSDLLELVDDPRASAVAQGVFTLAELLAKTPQWNPPDLVGAKIVVQPHCHHTAVLGFEADLALLDRTGASVTRLGGCCGLAGNFGVEKGHYDMSVAVAQQQLLPAVETAEPGTVFLADGFSCRTQLADLADVPAFHLAELLNRGGVGI